MQRGRRDGAPDLEEPGRSTGEERSDAEGAEGRSPRSRRARAKHGRRATRCRGGGGTEAAIETSPCEARAKSEAMQRGRRDGAPDLEEPVRSTGEERSDAEGAEGRSPRSRRARAKHGRRAKRCRGGGGTEPPI